MHHFFASDAADDALSLGPKAPAPSPRSPACNYTTSCYNVKCYSVIIL